MSANPLIASAPHPEDWRDGTGLLELLAICATLALMLIPSCIVRGLFLKRPLSMSFLEAWEFAAKGAVWGLLITVAIIALIGIPFGILNTIFLGITEKNYAWHLIIPSQLFLYGIVGFIIIKYGTCTKDKGKLDAVSESSSQKSFPSPTNLAGSPKAKEI